jgi:hypothetical protein
MVRGNVNVKIEKNIHLTLKLKLANFEIQTRIQMHKNTHPRLENSRSGPLSTVSELFHEFSAGKRLSCLPLRTGRSEQQGIRRHAIYERREGAIIIIGWICGAKILMNKSTVMFNLPG